MNRPVDPFPSVQSSRQHSSDSIYPSKQSNKTKTRLKDHSSHRTTSLSPTRQSSSSDDISTNIKQRRRYASDSTTNHIKNIPASLVISFLRHLRNELRATSNKNNGYHHVKQTSGERTNSTTILDMNNRIANDSPCEPADNNEILTLIDLLVLRVECLANEAKSKSKTKKVNCPTVAEVDQNLIEYLYYLFTKFINDEANTSDTLRIPIIDKSNFVNVCQTLVRNGCFDIPPGNISVSPDHSSSETTSSSDKTLTQQTLIREYHHDTDTMMAEKSSLDGENLSTTSAEQEAWLVVDLEDSIAVSEGMCQLTLSPSDEQLLISNDNYRSFESESTPSIYLSPNSSSFDLLNMVQTSEDSDSNNNNLLPNQNELPSTNASTEPTPNLSNDNICTGLSNVDHDNANHSAEASEPQQTDSSDRMSRREKKRQERWLISTKPDKNDSDPSKTLLTVEFPPIAVLRRKSSPATSNRQQDPSDSNLSTKVEEINTSPTLITVNTSNPDQIVELSSEDTIPLLITTDGHENIHVDEQLPLTESKVICLSEDEIIMSTEQGPLLSTTMECHTEIITTINNDSVESQPTNIENSSPVLTNPADSDLTSSFPITTSPPPPPAPVPATFTTDENKTTESLSKEKGEEKIEEEEEQQQRCNDDYSIDEEKKNTSSPIHDYHASGIILINDEPTQTALLHEEKKEREEQAEREKERPSSPLPTLEQFNQQRTEDESPAQTLSNDLNPMAMVSTDEKDELYKKVELEELPDDEEDTTTQNVDAIEPTDYILTDDEPKKSKQSSPTQSASTNVVDDAIKFDNVFTCYEKAMSRVVDKYDDVSEPSIVSAKESLVTNQEPANDPIALRALQRFEQRMNAASASKTTKDDLNPLTPKGKSSWSTSLSTSRKSLENLLKDEDQQLRPTTISLGDEIKTETTNSSSQADSYIRPRKTFDDSSLNYGTLLNLYTTTNSTKDKINHDDQKSDKEQQPSAIIDNDDKRVVDNNSTVDVNSTQDQQNEEKQELVYESITPNEIKLNNDEKEETSNLIPPTITDDDNAKLGSLPDTTVSQSATIEQSGFTPYHFQIEGRRRLNTVERMRERQTQDSFDAPESQHQQIQHEYTLKPEEVQDPIIRRALERFDEKNRTLTQTKSMNYDEIQDPITRRALMRLESNLKRTIPPPTIDSNENRYTESYTLGSLQPASDRLSRYTDSSQLPASNNNKAKYISAHQRYGTSADPSDISTTANFSTMTEQNIPVMRVPPQPIYVTSNNLSQAHEQQQPLSQRQRSRSEDMLATKDLVIGQTTNLDEIDTSSQLQRNRSSNEIALNDSNHFLPNSLIKTLEPHFVRTTESSFTYATPTQSYSAYSCEYTRPRRNATVTSSEASTDTFGTEMNQLPPKYPQSNELMHSSAYRPSLDSQYQTQPSSISSAFAPVRSSTATTTGPSTYYSQQSLPTPSYGAFMSSGGHNSTPYSEDPIVRRALERFNSQVQNSMLSTPHYLPPNNYASHQGSFNDNWANSNRSTQMTTSTSSNSSAGGYQSIIGRRRYPRHDELNNSSMDHSSIGDAYSSSLFNNPYATSNSYVNMSDEPPAIPPRFRRENYRSDDINDQYRRHSIDEYHSDNINNNNNNNILPQHPRETYIHHAYPATITNTTGFRPIDIHYNQPYDSYNHIFHEHDDFHEHTDSPSSIHSSDGAKQRFARSNHIQAPTNNIHRLPPPIVSVRTSTQPNGRKLNEQMVLSKISSNNSQSSSGQNLQNNGNGSGDSVFHRLAYTGTKASLSKSSSNSCSNLLNKASAQVPLNHLKSCEIELDESTNVIETNDNSEQIPSISSKCQRSKSVDGRARLKIIQARSNNTHTVNDHDENDYDDESKTVPSSKFIPINGRREGQPPPPRVPVTPPNAYRTSSLKRPTNGANIVYIKDSPGIRTQSYNGGALESENQQHPQQDVENDENISYNNDSYQPKILDNRTRTSIPVHRYTATNGNATTTNNIQQSTSAVAVNTTPSRIKPPTMIPISLEKRDSNSSNTDLNKTPRRVEEQRRSPPNQRRNVPVSVFSPAKLENKRPAPAPPTHAYESQPQLSYPARIPTTDTIYPSKSVEHDIEVKLSSTSADLKTSTEVPTPADNHVNNNSAANNKKMNVFERLFRGNKKKN